MNKKSREAKVNYDCPYTKLTARKEKERTTKDYFNNGRNFISSFLHNVFIFVYSQKFITAKFLLLRIKSF